MVLFMVASVEARGFGRGGGGGRGVSREGAASRGSFGRSGATTQRASAGNRSFSRSGAASNGNLQSSRSNLQSNRASLQSNRQQTAGDRQGNRQDYRGDAREDRQQYGKNRQEDRQDWADDYHSPYYRRGYYGSAPAGAGLVGLAAGIAIGSAISASQFRSTCTAPAVSINGVTYYQCGSSWYKPAYQGGNVTYIVVNPPR